MSDSIWNDPRITAYVLGELSSDERVEFEKEIEASDELASAVEDARSLTGMVEGLFAAESNRTLDNERREAIVAAPAHSTSVDNPSPSAAANESRSWKVPGVVLAIAATLLLMVGVGPWLNFTQETALKEVGKDAALAIESDMPEGLMEQGQAMSTAMRSGLSNANTESRDGAVASLSKQMDDLAAVGRYVDSPGEASHEFAAADPQTSQSQASAEAVSGEPESAGKTLRTLGGAVTEYSVAADELPAFQGTLPRRDALEGTKQDSNEFLDQAKNARSPMPNSARGVVADEEIGAADEDGDEAFLSDNDVLDNVTPSGELERENAPANRSTGLSRDSGGAGFGAGGGMSILSPTNEVVEDPLALNSARGRLQQSQPLGRNDTAEKKTELEFLDTIIDSDRSAVAASSDDPQGELNARRPGNAPQTTPVGGRGTTDGGNRALDEKQSRALGLATKGNREMSFGRQPGDDDGRGPGQGGDKFEPITDNPFQRVSEHRLSTFSVDVDTASYSKTRDFLLNNGSLPRPDAVRIEELVNYFDYDYAGPAANDEHPFAVHSVVTSCPWNKNHRLARIALKGKTIETEERPRCNLVFLLDTSGSMNQPNKLPLVIDGMKMLVDQLDKKDRVAITVYAGSAGLVLDSTKVKKKAKILRALTQLNAGGSTNGGAGIQLAYQTARDNFISDGVNRVILCTDGDFNVGTTGTDSLVRMVEQEAKGGIFLTVLGFGMGNHNDSMLEQVSGRGNGNYAFIDSQKEAHKVLVDQTNGTLMTIAKDVKLQIEFNPLQVSAYRLIGYENRVLAKEDFNDDKKDAGEIGAGHSVTALYEIVPAGVEADAIRPAVDKSVFVEEATPTDAAKSGLMMMLKLRYKQPDGDSSMLMEIRVKDDDIRFADADDDVRFAAAVAGFGMQLRRSDYRGNWTLSEVLAVAQGATGKDDSGLRQEFINMVRRASQLMGE